MKDFDKVVEKASEYETWWNNTNKRTIVYAVSSQRETEATNSRLKEGLNANWAIANAFLDILDGKDEAILEDAINLVMERLQREKYYIDGFPTVFLNLGPGSVSAAFSGFSELGENTVWFELKEPMSMEEIANFKHSLPNEYEKLASKLIPKIVEAFSEYAVVSQADLGGVLDIVASLRTTNNLLYDMHDVDKSLIEKACINVESVWQKHSLEYDSFTAKEKPYRTSWMNILSKEPFQTLQCDFAAMLSPDMFEEFVKPSIIRQCKNSNRNIFHHDGIPMLQHTDILCSIDELHAIQFTPGPCEHQVNSERWHSHYKKYIDAGKKVILLGWNANDMDGLKKLFKVLPRESFFLSIYPNNEKEVKEIEKVIYQYT